MQVTYLLTKCDCGSFRVIGGCGIFGDIVEEADSDE